ncbi:MAG: hypothetical protein HQL52_06195 [Magnetococcales bacterium]|nr:hypothetical protein [Magnetococcales bacterium]
MLVDPPAFFDFPANLLGKGLAHFSVFFILEPPSALSVYHLSDPLCMVLKYQASALFPKRNGWTDA